VKQLLPLALQELLKKVLFCDDRSELEENELRTVSISILKTCQNVPRC
jgi:hypothetical protein